MSKSVTVPVDKSLVRVLRVWPISIALIGLATVVAFYASPGFMLLTAFALLFPVFYYTRYRKNVVAMRNSVRAAIKQVDAEAAKELNSKHSSISLAKLTRQLLWGKTYDWAITRQQLPGAEVTSYYANRNIQSIKLGKASSIILTVREEPKQEISYAGPGDVTRSVREAVKRLPQAEVVSAPFSSTNTATHPSSAPISKRSRTEVSLRRRSERLTERLALLAKENLSLEQRHVVERIQQDQEEGWSLYETHARLNRYVSSAAAESKMNSIITDLEKEAETLLAQVKKVVLNQMDVHGLYVNSTKPGNQNGEEGD